MSTIHVASGTGVAPTAKSAYDAALADANVHDYNLVPVSSIVPADAEVVEVDRMPDLGPAGNRMFVVQAEREMAGPGTLAAGVGWATGPGPGLFYEAASESQEEVHARLTEGLAAGRELRDWTLEEEDLLVESAEASPGEHTCVVAVAAYGESEPIC